MTRPLALLLVAACTAAPTGPVPDPTTDPDIAGDETSDGTFDPGDVLPHPSPHLTLGPPLDDSPDDDYVIVQAQRAFAYSPYLNSPTWVSWRTRPVDFGPVERFPGPFYADTALPAGFFRVDHGDFTNSGYDRGHMLRSEERTRTEPENIATFVMTNVMPQRADLNRGPWFDFELYIQRKVQSTSRPRDAYVLAGAVWSAACATHAPRQPGDGCLDIGRTTTPANRIAVPAASWKVVVFVDAGVPPRQAVDPYIVAVVMPNTSGIDDTRWWEYRTTVADVEQQSGYDLPSLD